MSAVDLTPTWTVGDVVLTDYPYSVDRDDTVDLGEPEVIVEVTPSMLGDGAVERVIGHGNRTYALSVYVEGADLAELADHEATLRRAITTAGVELSHNPGDDVSPTSVYQVLVARMTPQRMDSHESHLLRKFTLTFTCAPFARSAELTTITALTSSETDSAVVVDACDSTTGWSTGIHEGDYLTQIGGAVYAYDSASGNNFIYLRRLASIDVSAHPYFALEWKASPVSTDLKLGLPGVGDVNSPAYYQTELRRVALADGWFKSVWLVGPNDLSSGFDFILGQSSSRRPVEGDYLAIREVSKSSQPPGDSPRQLTRIIEPGGTERTPCSLQVIPGAAEALGVAIVHTSPEEGVGYSPSLRQRRVLGNTVTADSTLLSGAREPVNASPIVAHVPIASLPEDGYSLVAFMRSSVAGTYSFSWQARTIVNESYYLGGHEGTTQARFFDANTWTLVPLAILTLPPVRASEGGTVQFNITHTPVGAEVIDLDEWWIFRIGDDCALTMVQEFETSFLWLDSPDSSSPVPRIWVGGNSDRSDQHHPGVENLIAQGNHVLHPAGTTVFAASTGITYPGVSATYHKRWHSNAAE